MIFGCHFQEGDESRLVFNSWNIVYERLVKKAFYVSLNLLPSLIRVLLIHGHYLSFLNEDDGCLGVIPGLCFHRTRLVAIPA